MPSTSAGHSGRLLAMIDQRTRLVHQVVAEAFHGPRPAGLETRHLDGDLLNNRSENLAYGTHGDNVADSVLHGTHPNASKAECPVGHPLDDGYRNRRGARVCRPCANRQSRESRARQRA